MADIEDKPDFDLSLEDELKKAFMSSGNESELYAFARSLFGDITTKTDIPRQDDKVMQIIRIIYFAKECERFEISSTIPKLSDIVRDIILENYYKLRLSVERKSRKEAFTFLNRTLTKEDNGESWFKRVFTK